MLKKLPSFIIAFLVSGLPLIFIIREYLPIPKTLFTYAVVGLIIVLLLNIKKILTFRFYSSIPFFLNIMLFILLLLFTVNIWQYDMIQTNLSESFYTFIIFFIFIALLTRKNTEFNYLFHYILIFSSLNTILTIITTPLDASYWYATGSRLFVGDTKNPNISSFIALVNVISIIYYFYINKNVSLIKKVTLVSIMGLSFYIYYLTFSKSAILGLFLCLIILVPIDFFKKKETYYFLIVSIISFTVISLIFSTLFDNILLKIEVLISSFYSYFYGISENIARDSAAIRHIRLKEVLPILYEINLFTGNGIFTTRTDFPLLQVFTDLGFFAGFLNLFIMLIYPIYLIIIQLKNKKYLEKYSNEYFAMMIYIFNLPNLIWHGTPYETSIWIPILIYLKLNLSRERVVANG